VTFVAPPEKEIEWTDAGLEGSFRFLARVWRLVDAVCETVAGEGIPAPVAADLDESERALRRKTHDTIRRVTQDLDPRVHLNTAVSALMELVNELYQFCDRPGRSISVRRAEAASAAGVVERKETVAVLKEAVEALVLMLSPFAPHMAEELWERLGHAGGIASAAWPGYDAEVAKAEETVVPVQINGKVRARLTVATGTSDADLQARALADPHVQAHVKDKAIKKIVVVNGGKLVSIVV
jgi:leucyl-tRNA synthetase